MIKKEGNKYILYSKDGSKELGSFDTEEEALKREREINYFKFKKYLPLLLRKAIETTEDYIRIRMKDPDDFIRFRTMQLKEGIKAVIGFKEGGGSEVQAYLFDNDKFDKDEAKAWVKEHEKDRMNKHINLLIGGMNVKN